MRRLLPFALSPFAATLASAVASTLAWAPAHAQTDGTAAATLPTIGVTTTPERQNRASVSGWGDGPAWRAPYQAQTFSQDALQQAQVTRLAELTKLDASVTDSYNTAGYWDILAIRGFTLDNTSNYRRDGLPINGETRLPLDNKAAVEVYKGISGLQAGVSAPGGLVNLLVKRPEGRTRSVGLSATDAGAHLTTVDLGDRFGDARQFGARLNLAAERLDTPVDGTRGQRKLAALATDWRLNPGHLIEFEIESSRLAQPSAPGYSLLDGRVPSIHSVDRTRNFNRQDWTLPVVMAGTTGSLRWQGDLGQGLRARVTYGEQHLQSADRAGFPFGCGFDDFAQYCANGDFAYYDYRSEGERRITRSLLSELEGEARIGGMGHRWQLSLLRSLHKTDVNNTAFNYVGDGNTYTGVPGLTPDPTALGAGLDRTDRSTELALRDEVALSESLRAWLGVRHTQIRRNARSTADGTAAPRISEDLTTPWLGLGYTLAPSTQAYVSWGEGVEVLHVPAVWYGNAGAPLPVHKSRQTEVGLKGQAPWLNGQQNWSVSLFAIRKPQGAGNPATGEFLLDGTATHRGLELQWQGRRGPWQLAAGGMWIDTERRGSANPAVNGQESTNVPEHTLRLSGQYTLPLTWPVSVQADLVREGRRWVDVANTARLPAWNRVDLTLKTTTPHTAGQQWMVQLGVTNLLDAKAWREAPALTGHYYLFPMLPRTVTLSARLDF